MPSNIKELLSPGASKKGAALMTAMSILLLMVIMGISIFQTTIQTRHMSTFLKNSSEAQYLAEAGIRDALATLDNLGFAARNNAANFPLTTFGAGTYDVTVTETGGRVLLTSVGTVNNVSKTVSVEVADNTPTALDYMMSAGNDMNIMSGLLSLVRLEGQIHANNAMYLKSVVLAGIRASDSDASTGPDAGASLGTVHLYAILGFVRIGETTYWPLKWNSQINGGQPQVELPTFDYIYYKDLALMSDGNISDSLSDDYYNGDQIFGAYNTTTTLEPVNGIIYVDGNVTFRGTVNLYGGIIANNITVASKLTSPISIGELHQLKTTPTDLRRNIIISQQDILIGGRLYAEEALIFANRDFRVLQGVDLIDIDGTMIAGRDLNVWDFICLVDYDHVMVVPDRSHQDVWVQVVSWNQ